MAATVTLSTTTVTYPIGAGDTSLALDSTSGVVPGVRLYIDRELLTVVSAGLGSTFNVLRGQDGTAGTPHASGATVYIGRGDQFYINDPMGMPPPVVLVSPWINAVAGRIWLAQGDEGGSGAGARFWQQVVYTPSAGPLGIRVMTATPTS